MAAVNRHDIAPLFLLALENAAPGTVLHAVADEGDAMRSLAEAIGRVPAVPVEPAPPQHFGLLGHVFTLDMPSSSALNRQQSGWQPTHSSRSGRASETRPTWIGLGIVCRTRNTAVRGARGVGRREHDARPGAGSTEGGPSFFVKQSV
jgi:hypothetical protein